MSTGNFMVDAVDRDNGELVPPPMRELSRHENIAWVEKLRRDIAYHKDCIVGIKEEIEELEERIYKS